MIYHFLLQLLISRINGLRATSLIVRKDRILFYSCMTFNLCCFLFQTNRCIIHHQDEFWIDLQRTLESSTKPCPWRLLIQLQWVEMFNRRNVSLENCIIKQLFFFLYIFAWFHISYSYLNILNGIMSRKFWKFVISEKIFKKR